MSAGGEDLVAIYNYKNKMNELMEELAKHYNPCPTEEDEIEEVETFLPPEKFKPFLEKLFKHLSEDDARELLQAVFNEISRDNRTVRLGKRIETAVLQFMVETLHEKRSASCISLQYS